MFNQKQDILNSKKTSRNQLINLLRKSSKGNPNIKKNTIQIDDKIKRKISRYTSLQLDADSLLLLEKEEEEQFQIIDEFQDKYIYGSPVGQGAHGKVKKCTRKGHIDQKLVVKIIKMEDEQIFFLQNNFKSIKKLKHINLIRYKELYFNKSKRCCYLVMQYCNYAKLKYPIVSEQELRYVIIGILQGLIHLHEHHICHRDIKPDNILYDRTSKSIKIIDFGISANYKKRQKLEQMLTITGTFYYRAPQLFLGGGYNNKVDIWAVGITIYQLIVGKTPFESDYHHQVIDNIINQNVSFKNKVWDNYSKEFKNFISGLLIKKKQLRLSATDARKHFWLNCNNQIEDKFNRSMEMQGDKQKIQKDINSFYESNQSKQLRFLKRRSDKMIKNIRNGIPDYDQEDFDI